MNNKSSKVTRRHFNLAMLATGATLLTATGSSSTVSAQTNRSLRIGIIGSGKIGGAIGRLWAAAGHEILFSSRNPDKLAPLVAEAGPLTRAGLPAEAAEFGEVVFLALPYGAIPQIGRDFGHLMQGKVVIDCSNPNDKRDGDMAIAALAKGTGVATAGYIPGTRVVRAFGTINYQFALDNAHREGDKIAIPIAGDDDEAVAIAKNLVIDAGFDPVIVGGLERSNQFDRGGPGYLTNTTADELKKLMGL